MHIKTKQAEYSILGELGLLVNREIEKDISFIKRRKIKNETAVEYLKKGLTDKEIIKKLSNCLSLLFEVTEECNFRCKYCVYSGKFKDERIHSKKKMSIETAIKAVDLFFKTIKSPYRKRKSRSIFIGFYGGECLLELDFIKDVIEYVEKTAASTDIKETFNINYRLTSNGFLMEGDVVDFLKEKNVMVDISLDGPEKEHDKFRVTRDGEKSWAKIMKNLESIKQRFPDYYDKYISFLVTQHPNHDCAAVDKFFGECPEYFYDNKVKFNYVNFDKFNKEEQNLLKKTILSPGKLHFSQICSELEPKFAYRYRTPHSQMTATCFPGGEKIFVSTSGKLKVCEKMSELAPAVGHVETGFDFEGIRNIIKSYNKEIIRNKCWDCDQWFLCGVCFANVYKEGRFTFNCPDEKARILVLLQKFLERKEDRNEKKHPDINNDSVIDFIERL